MNFPDGVFCVSKPGKHNEEDVLVPEAGVHIDDFIIDLQIAATLSNRTYRGLFNDRWIEEPALSRIELFGLLLKFKNRAYENIQLAQKQLDEAREHQEAETVRRDLISSLYKAQHK